MRLVARWAMGSAQEAEDILAAGRRLALGGRAGRAARRGAEDRRDDQDGHDPGAGVHGRPGPGPSVLPGDGGGFDIEAFLRESGTLYLIAEIRVRGQPGRAAVRRHGRRDPLRRRAGRAGLAAAGGWTRRC